MNKKVNWLDIQCILKVEIWRKYIYINLYENAPYWTGKIYEKNWRESWLNFRKDEMSHVGEGAAGQQDEVQAQEAQDLHPPLPGN